MRIEFPDGSSCTVRSGNLLRVISHTPPASDCRVCEIVVSPAYGETEARSFSAKLIDLVERLAQSSIIGPGATRDAAPAHVPTETDQPQPLVVSTDDDHHE